MPTLNAPARFRATGLALLLVLPLYSHSSAAADPEKGRQLYEANCKACHGPTGLGDGVAASGLRERPDNLYRKLRKRGEAKMIRKMMEGDTDMPAYRGVLSVQEGRHIFAWIRQVNR